MHSDECLHVYVLCAHAFSTQYTAGIFAVYLGIFQYLLRYFLVHFCEYYAPCHAYAL